MATPGALGDAGRVPEGPKRDDPSHRLVTAIAPPDADVPAAFRTFDRIARSAEPPPDFTEHSARFGESLAPHRATHYFDVDVHGRGIVRDVGSRFLAMTSALGLPVVEPLETLLLEGLPERSEIQQVVLGIDARAATSATRTKYYVLFREPAPSVVERMRGMLGLPPFPGLPVSEVFLVGIDVDATGVSDLKVYLRLDRTRLARTIRNRAAVRALVDGARDVVLQQCLRQASRRQLHFHATDDTLYADWLARRAMDDAGVAELLRHASAVEARLGGGRLGPWIVGLEHHDATLRLTSGNVYFHVTEGAARRARERR